jgi:hypothetical protein
MYTGMSLKILPSLSMMSSSSISPPGIRDESGTLEDYSSRPSKLLEAILLDYKVLGGLSYGLPWAHYLGGHLGLPVLCHTTPDCVRRKDYGGEVLG